MRILQIFVISYENSDFKTTKSDIHIRKHEEYNPSTEEIFICKIPLLHLDNTSYLM